MLFDGRINKLTDIFLMLWGRGYSAKLVELSLHAILSTTIRSYHEGVALIFNDGQHFFFPPYTVCSSDEAPRDIDLIEYLDDSSSKPWGTWLNAFAFCGIDVEEAERIRALVREYQEPSGNITFDFLATTDNTNGENDEYFSFEY